MVELYSLELGRVLRQGQEVFHDAGAVLGSLDDLLGSRCDGWARMQLVQEHGLSQDD